MDATAFIVPAQMAYMSIPAKELRNFVDSTFPSLAVNPIADSARGFGHRYVAGHDLLLDIPRTMANHGPGGAINHAGHILLTDFPTKAGIPIPLFSQSGLGQFLEEIGIHRGWLQISLFDTGIGILAISEGSENLALALQGSLNMDWGVFFDTFVKGGVEIAYSLATQNPFLMVGGVENMLAGVVATWNTLSVYVDPLDFFGAGGVSVLMGFGLSYSIAGENLSDAGKNAIRSGVVGSLFSLSLAFGFGALSGFAAYGLGQQLAKLHAESMNSCLSINDKTYALLLDEISKGNLPAKELMERVSPRILASENGPQLSARCQTLGSAPIRLIGAGTLLEKRATRLSQEVPNFSTDVRSLPDDPSFLVDYYKMALAS